MILKSTPTPSRTRPQCASSVMARTSRADRRRADERIAGDLRAAIGVHLLADIAEAAEQQDIGARVRRVAVAEIGHRIVELAAALIAQRGGVRKAREREILVVQLAAGETRNARIALEEQSARQIDPAERLERMGGQAVIGQARVEQVRGTRIVEEVLGELAGRIPVARADLERIRRYHRDGLHDRGDGGEPPHRRSARAGRPDRMALPRRRASRAARRNPTHRRRPH